MEKSKMGKLIVFEGISSSGKGTQMELLNKNLVDLGYNVVTTSWNSDEILNPIISEFKHNHLLTKYTWTVLHATEFAKRYKEVILPALLSGKVVIADRYFYTALSRDTVRGIDESYIKELYSYALRPSITFLFDISPKVAYQRRLSRYPKFGHYSTGKDIIQANNDMECWIKYNTLLKSKYLQLANTYNMKIIDATETVDNISKELIMYTRQLLQIVSD